MQYNQPFCPGYPVPVCGPCIPAPTYPYNPMNTAPTYSRPYPEVVGEGDVTSLTMPDGGTQLYFVPASKSCPSPPMFNSGFGNCYCNQNQGMWFIRSVCNNLFPQPSFQQNQISWGGNPQFSIPISRSIYAFSSRCNLKFHNDCSTSTSDIHYFYPGLRTCNVVPRACASVQVQMETTKPVCQCSAVECKNTRNDKSTGSEAIKCGCSQTDRRNRKQRRQNKHKRSSDSRSCMSIDSTQSKSRKPRKNKRKKDKKTKRKHCRCKSYRSEKETAGSSQSYMSVDESTFTNSSCSCSKKRKKAKKGKRRNHSHSDSDETESGYRGFMCAVKRDSCANTEINDYCDICDDCYMEIQQAKWNELKPVDKQKPQSKTEKHKTEKNRKEKDKTGKDKSLGIKIRDSAIDKAKPDDECYARTVGNNVKQRTSRSKLKINKKSKQKHHDKSKHVLSKCECSSENKKMEETSRDKVKTKEEKNKSKTSVEFKSDLKGNETATSDSDLCECCSKASVSEKGSDTCGDTEADPCSCYPLSNKQHSAVIYSGPAHCCIGAEGPQLASNHSIPIELWFARSRLSNKKTPPHKPPLNEKQTGPHKILSTTYCASDSIRSSYSDFTR